MTHTVLRYLQKQPDHWSRGYRENARADFPDVPVPASQLVALQKKSLNRQKLNLREKQQSQPNEK